LVSEGVLLMAVGMATVFAFLGVLVGLMQGSAAFFEAFGDRFAEPEVPTPSAGATPGGAGNDDEIAIVLAAIEAHRRGRGGAGA